MKVVQKFSDEYLIHCQKLKTDEVLQFLDDFRKLISLQPSKRKLISLKVPIYLLDTFRTQSENMGLKYQTLIQQLMEDWVFLQQRPTQSNLQD